MAQPNTPKKEVEIDKFINFVNSLKQLIRNTGRSNFLSKDQVISLLEENKLY